jgi:outer membrane PBP1 activator LpoA protein
MLPSYKFLLNSIVICLAALLIGACASTPPAPVLDLSEVSRAQEAQATGNFSEAARLWQEAALVSVGPERENYRLRAAEAWLQAGENNLSESVLEQVDENQLFNDRLARYSLLHAELALISNDAQSAEIYLAAARPNLTSGQQSRYQRLLDRSARLQTDPATFALATAASTLQAGIQYSTTRGVAILQLLEDVPSDALENIPAETTMAYGLNHWPDLAIQVRQTLVGSIKLDDAAELWASGHPDHEVTESGFKELVGRYRQMFSLPANIAVLLPLEGGLAAAGAAIRDGLLSAFLARSEDVTLKFYPTSDDPQSAVSAYFQAVGEGAQWIIGPLALNNMSSTSESRSRDNLLFGLSLSQEHEAHAVARKALENEQTKAIMITADSPWGSRMESAFAEAFIAGGGTIITTARFNPAESDHSSLLTENRSKQ